MSKNKNILIRDLTPLQQTQLVELKYLTGQKTASQAILRVLADYKELRDSKNEAWKVANAAKKELNLYKETFENIKFQVSCLPE